MLLIIFSFLLQLASAQEKNVERTYIHVHKKDPFFIFQIKHIPNWKITRESDTSVRFYPGPAYEERAKFEVPPSLNMIAYARVKTTDIAMTGSHEEGKNLQNVNYSLVFLKGWETPAYLMSLKSDKVFINNAIGEYSDYGLSGKAVLKEARDTFTYIDPQALDLQSLELIIREAGHHEVIETAQKVSGHKIDLKADDQKDRYVVTFREYRGTPVFHVLKENLKVDYLNKPEKNDSKKIN